MLKCRLELEGKMLKCSIEGGGGEGRGKGTLMSLNTFKYTILSHKAHKRTISFIKNSLNFCWIGNTGKDRFYPETLRSNLF